MSLFTIIAQIYKDEELFRQYQSNSVEGAIKKLCEELVLEERYREDMKFLGTLDAKSLGEGVMVCGGRKNAWIWNAIINGNHVHTYIIKTDTSS
jgi:REP element-mobilizing transposase RayT